MSATVEDALYTRLSGYSGLSALVGTRISPLKLTQNSTLPAVTFQRISANRVHAMGADPGIVTARYQVTSWGDGKDGADGYGDVKDVAVQVLAALSRYSGTVGTIQIDGIFFDDGSDNDVYDPETERVGVAQDFIVHYRE